MHYTLIIAGGSGTRLWPMSRKPLPKQLIPFIGGKSLLQIADERLEGLVPRDHRYICAGLSHQQAVSDALDAFSREQFIGEPMGRDTLNAVGLGAAVISRDDPDAVIGVFTADHLIEPADQFQKIVIQGFELAQTQPNTLVTFGITPTHAATGYGYLQLGQPIEGQGARTVEHFREKPKAEAAQQYFDVGPDRYLWNSGMFVWPAATLLDCIRRYKPENYAGLMRIAEAWGTARQQDMLSQVYPTLEKISIDYAVMEPASGDSDVQVAALPMPLSWLDIGSWPAFAKTCKPDQDNNVAATDKHITIDTCNTLLASNDPNHLIATIGCEGLLVVHTPDATLVCRADHAEDIKKLHELVGQRYGDEFV